MPVRMRRIREDSCNICNECSGKRETCKNAFLSRPTPEVFAVDVYASVRQMACPIEALSRYSQKVNCYAFLLIE